MKSVQSNFHVNVGWIPKGTRVVLAHGDEARNRRPWVMAGFYLLVVSSIAVFLAIKLKPSHESFEVFYRAAYLGEDPDGKKQKKKGVLGGMLECLLPGSTAKSFPPTTLHDCFVFHLAVVKLERDLFAYFLGAFGMWIPLMAPEPKPTKGQIVAENKAFERIETVKHEAISLKANSKCTQLKKLFKFIYV